MRIGLSKNVPQSDTRFPFQSRQGQSAIVWRAHEIADVSSYAAVTTARMRRETSRQDVYQVQGGCSSPRDSEGDDNLYRGRRSKSSVSAWRLYASPANASFSRAVSGVISTLPLGSISRLWIY